MDHISCLIQFTLVVDNFGIKYVGKEHANHLLSTLKEHYTIDIDWEGKLYCGIILTWDYIKKHVDISMPGYIKKLLQRFQHELRKAQHSPYSTVLRKNMVRMPKILFQSMTPQNFPKQASSESNKLLAQSSTTPDVWTSLYS
jgi:hypothetical protein